MCWCRCDVCELCRQLSSTCQRLLACRLDSTRASSPYSPAAAATLLPPRCVQAAAVYRLPVRLRWRRYAHKAALQSLLPCALHLSMAEWLQQALPHLQGRGQRQLTAARLWRGASAAADGAGSQDAGTDAVRQRELRRQGAGGVSSRACVQLHAVRGRVWEAGCGAAGVGRGAVGVTTMCAHGPS